MPTSILVFAVVPATRVGAAGLLATAILALAACGGNSAADRAGPDSAGTPGSRSADTDAADTDAAGTDLPGTDAANAARAALDPEFVGGGRCAACHQQEAAAWAGSHHDLAMQPAAGAAVLGDFDDAEFRYGDTSYRFFRRGGAYWVTADGSDGEPTDFEIAWTFGVDPLQQYLVELADGKVQALTVAWDTRPADQGGQRWFHLYPDERIEFTDPLHWTGVYQRWNTSCADCHSTGLDKGFDPERQAFATGFSRVDVDCEGCHGPGSNHVADPSVAPEALAAVERGWHFDEGASIASRVPAGDSSPAEVEVCAQCHSRRTQLTDAHAPGDPLLDAYRPALLEPGLYHADGQIRDEVYVYGSFLQSAMAAAGVTCSDCHDPHTATLRFDGNALCGQCHLASTFDRPSHHRHAAGTEAAECTSCHMRTETYMVVDPRRDHSFRVPRPDLSAEIESPNACNDCHADRTSDWAAERVAEWFPDGRWNDAHFGQALKAGRTWAEDARRRLTALIDDADQPAIARATAVAAMAERLSGADAAWIEARLEEPNPLLQLAAIGAAGRLEPSRRAELLQRFLTADLRALRIAAARALSPARAALSERRQRDLDAAMAEYLEVQAFNSDRPEGLLNAAAAASEQGRLDDAEALYRDALARYPGFPALYVNLSDLYRQRGREADAEALLREGAAVHPDDASIKLALALALVRAGERGEALTLLADAAAAAPDEPYYRYLLAIAENDAGNRERALELLRAADERFPGYPDTLLALATILRDAGEIDAAHGYAGRLVVQRPGDADAIALRDSLARSAARP